MKYIIKDGNNKLPAKFTTYFSDIVDGSVFWVQSMDMVKKFNTAEEASQFIKANKLTEGVVVEFKD